MAINQDAIAAIQEIDTDGSLGLLKEVVHLFVHSIPTELAELAKYQQENNPDLLAEAAHRFKSSCQNVGATEMALRLSQLETEKATLTFEKRQNLINQINILAQDAEKELLTLISS